MKTIIYLIRHGQTDWNKQFIIQGQQNNPLNDTGCLQAREVGQRLISLDITDFDVCLASPLDRAHETGEVILKELGLNKEIITCDLVIERDFGEAENKDITKEIYNLINLDQVKGMETRKEMMDRAYKFYEYVLNTYPGKKVIVFTHSHFIKSFVMNFNPSLSYDGCVINNCSINICTVDGVNVSLECNK